MDNDYIIINQSFFNRFKNKFLLSSFNSSSKLFLESDQWHDLEEAEDGNVFRWSQPLSKIKFENVNGIVVNFSCPIGREIHIYNNRINETLNLIPNKLYKVLINVSGTQELCFETEAYVPEQDTRELGVCFNKISEHAVLSCI